MPMQNLGVARVQQRGRQLKVETASSEVLSETHKTLSHECGRAIDI